MKVSIDLHIHSCLSPCGDTDMTPNNIVNMAYIKELDVISVTDHNSIENVEVIMELGRKRGILVIPGMEVTTKEEIHVLCYFESLEDGLEFQEIIYDSLPNIPNRPEIFGRQLICDIQDNIKGEVTKLLLNGTSYSISQINNFTRHFNGVMIPAHVDKKSFSILSTLGFIPEDLKLKTLEVSTNFDTEKLKNHIDVNRYSFIRNSDAHYLKDINEPVFYLDIKTKTVKSVIDCLRQGWGIEK